ncbi:MAG TPA: hypothetical protein VM864_14230 [Pyrinomonadaceae bacterium]|jgi:hypothetical protein|nr:hypothetical protein [Pyrinomonadaceae bacterium]
MREEDKKIEQDGVRDVEEAGQNVILGGGAELDGGDITVARNEPPIIIQGGGDSGNTGG